MLSGQEALEITHLAVDRERHRAARHKVGLHPPAHRVVEAVTGLEWNFAEPLALCAALAP